MTNARLAAMRHENVKHIVGLSSFLGTRKLQNVALWTSNLNNKLVTDYTWLPTTK